MKPYSIQRKFQLSNPIIKAYYYKDNYYVVDCKNTLYILNDDCEILLKMKLVKEDKEIHHYANHYSFSNGILSIANANKILCTKYQDKKVKLIYKKEFDSKDIIYSALSQNGDMILNCSIEGRASILNTASKSHYYTFENEPDYFSSAFFSSKDIFVFVGYFNLKNKILNLKNLKLMEFVLEKPVESGMFFDNDTKLFLADRAGNSIIYDCINEKIISTKILFDEWVSCSIVINEKYSLVGTRKDKLYLLNLSENELIATLDLNSHGVTSLSIAGEKLVISYADSTIELIDLDYLKENFTSHLNLHEYKEAKNILEKNIFLHLDENIEKFKSGFSKVIFQAKELVSKGEIEEALQIVSPFISYPQFNKEIELLFVEQDRIIKFMEVIEKNDIKAAYSLAAQNHIIPTLYSYQVLEKQWEKAFGEGRKAIESDNLYGKKTAKTILDVYSRTTQKSEIVKQLLFNFDKFSLADKLVKKQNFEEYFKLTKKFNFLEDTLLYKKIDGLASSLKSKAQEAFSDNNLTSAKGIYSRLLVFPEYSVHAKKSIHEIDTKIKLQDFIESNDLESVYSHVQKYTYLEYEDIFLKYNLRFEEDIQNSIRKMEKDSISDAIKILNKYFLIPYLDEKVANIFKRTYLSEFENNNLKDYNFIYTILSYQELFGIDEEIKEIFKKNQLEDEFRFALKSNANIDIDKYPETLLTV